MTRRLSSGIGCYFEMDIKNSVDGLRSVMDNVTNESREFILYKQGYDDALDGILMSFGLPTEDKENTHDSRSRYLIEPRRY